MLKSFFYNEFAEQRFSTWKLSRWKRGGRFLFPSPARGLFSLERFLIEENDLKLERVARRARSRQMGEWNRRQTLS